MYTTPSPLDAVLHKYRNRKWNNSKFKWNERAGAGRTGHFEVDADTPVRGALGAVDIKVPKPDFADALDDDASLFVACNADFLATLVVGSVEAVDEIEVMVSEWCGWVRRLCRGCLEIVQEGVVVLVLVLSNMYELRSHSKER